MKKIAAFSLFCAFLVQNAYTQEGMTEELVQGSLAAPVIGTPGPSYFNANHYALPHPTFSWTQVDNAQWYEINIFEVNTGNLVIKEGTQATSWTLSSDDNTLVVGQRYNWKVRAYASASGFSPWSTTAEFTVITPPSGNWRLVYRDDFKSNSDGWSLITALLQKY